MSKTYDHSKMLLDIEGIEEDLEEELSEQADTTGEYSEYTLLQLYTTRIALLFLGGNPNSGYDPLIKEMGLPADTSWFETK